MSGVDWGRCDDPALAIARILEGADKAFVELGVPKASMAKIAEFAGCSRVTLYRYFENRHALHRAYIDWVSADIVECVHRKTGEIADPRARVVEAILASVAEVRERPGAAAWFEPSMAGVAARMSRSSEVIEPVAAGFFEPLLAVGSPSRDPMAEKWLWRVIVSLLTSPEESQADERAMVERFVLPALFA